ncbi:unnamed protein product [Brachionus calyciflorus]|uniref:DUF4709 domain-containing protein n=1 Tax=Brachionus calyciflorus TaxID=104777 RepID=A0A813P1U5_9BILA|nr:unnamed protein product [Brachionus calyciflorus]
MLSTKTSTMYSSSLGDKGTAGQFRLMTGNLSQLINRSKIFNDKQVIERENFDIDNSTSSKTLETYHPSISDQIKVGFYSTDRCTQTNETEILILKNASDNLDFLCNEISRVKADLKFAKNSSENQFNQELSNKSIEIYTSINNKIRDLKLNQEQNLERIRHAYKSKLANAVSYFQKLADDQKAYFKIELEKQSLKTLKKSNPNQEIQKLKELQRTIIEQELEIKNLRNQIIENNEKANSEANRIIDQLKEDREKAIENGTKLQQKISRLEEALTLKEEETEKMNSEIINLQMQIEKEKIHYEELSKEMLDFKKTSEQEKAKMKKEFEKQKITMETKFNEKIKESTEQIMNAAKQELKQQQMLQKQQEQELLEEKKRQEAQYNEMLKKQQETLEREKLEKEKELERVKREKQAEEEALRQQQISLTEALQKEKERELSNAKSASNKDTELILKLKSNENYLKSEINRLKREIHRNNETWEKKFDILKHSLHAIKDEMYLRQNLQKQSANLAYASVAYTMNQAPNLQQQLLQTNDSNSKISNKPVLPSIGSAKNLDRQISLSLTVPSRLSGNLDDEENQIVDEVEMFELKKEFFNDVDFIPAKEA